MGGGEPVIEGHASADDRIISNLMKRKAVKNNIGLAQKHVAIVDKELSVLDDDERRIYRASGNVDRLCSELDIKNPLGVL